MPEGNFSLKLAEKLKFEIRYEDATKIYFSVHQLKGNEGGILIYPHFQNSMPESKFRLKVKSRIL